MKLSTSASSLTAGRLTRTPLRATSAGSPIASSTWLAATLPDEQADPAETAIPSEIERDHHGLRGKSRDCEQGRIRQPLRIRPEQSSLPAKPRAAPASILPRSADEPARIPKMVTREPRRNAKARPRLRHSRCRRGGAAPARRPSAAAPAGGLRSARISAPTPCGPPSLWAERARKSTPSAVDVDGYAAERLRGIAEHIAAMRLHDTCSFGDRVDHARLVVGEHQRDIGRALGSGRARQAPAPARRDPAGR